MLTTYVLSNLSGPSRKSKNPSVVLYPSPPLVVRAKSLVSVLVIPPSKLIICGASSLLAVVKGDRKCFDYEGEDDVPCGLK